MKQITFSDIKNNPEFKEYIKKGNELLGVLGFTDHSAAHTMKVAEVTFDILNALGFPERTCELGKMAGFIHDIGNVINRHEHAQSGALMAFSILSRMEMPPEEIAIIIGAVGNHDEGCGNPISPVCAALIIADKADVRRSRVRNKDFATFDIHDRVNYAAEKCSLIVNKDEKSIMLSLKIDDRICPIIEYFEIFLSRMLMCRKAAQFLDVNFLLNINDVRLL